MKKKIISYALCAVVSVFPFYTSGRCILYRTILKQEQYYQTGKTINLQSSVKMTFRFL